MKDSQRQEINNKNMPYLCPHLLLKYIIGILPWGRRCQITADAFINGSLTYCSFIANCALNHMLVKFAIQVDEWLAHTTVYHWNATSIWTGDGGVWRGEFCWKETSDWVSHTYYGWFEHVNNRSKVGNYQKYPLFFQLCV